MTQEWYDSNAEVYCKEGMPYGLIEFEDTYDELMGKVCVIKSCSLDNGKFTGQMIYDIYQKIKHVSVVIPFSVESNNVESIKKLLTRLGLSIVTFQDNYVAYKVKETE
jgi:hypothetical protein